MQLCFKNTTYFIEKISESSDPTFNVLSVTSAHIPLDLIRSQTKLPLIPIQRSKPSQPLESLIKKDSSLLLTGSSDGKESVHNAGDQGLTPWVRKIPGEGNGNSSLQYSCLENSMDRGAWRATVHGVAKSWTLLSN